jgi:hypothetical protein
MVYVKQMGPSGQRLTLLSESTPTDPVVAAGHVNALLIGCAFSGTRATAGPPPPEAPGRATPGAKLTVDNSCS